MIIRPMALGSIAAVLLLIIAGLFTYQLRKEATSALAPTLQSDTKQTSNKSGVPTTPVRIFSVGYAVRHPNNFLSQEIRVQGYLLKKGNGFAMFSDEASGPVTAHDLPVIGDAIQSMSEGHIYTLVGQLKEGPINGANGNPYHFEANSGL